MEPVGMAPAAPAPSETVEQAPHSRRGGKADLFARRKQQTRWVKLPDHEKDFLLVALRPIEVQEINTYCLETVPDPKHPAKEKRQFHPMRPFYLIGRALCESDGKPMFPLGSGGPQATWLYAGEQVANFLTNQECNILFDVVSELSGLTDRSGEDAEKNSGRTGSGSASSTSPSN